MPFLRCGKSGSCARSGCRRLGVFVEQRAGQLVAQLAGEADSVTGVAERIPDPVDAADVRGEIEWDGQLATPHMADGRIGEFGPIADEGGAEVGGCLLKIEVGVEAPPPTEKDAIVVAAAHVVQQPFAGISLRPVRKNPTGYVRSQWFGDDDVGANSHDGLGSRSLSRRVV